MNESLLHYIVDVAVRVFVPLAVVNEGMNIAMVEERGIENPKKVATPLTSVRVFRMFPFCVGLLK